MRSGVSTSGTRTEPSRSMTTGRDQPRMARAGSMERHPVSLASYLTVISGLLILLGLYLTSLYSYLLFHSLAEIFSVVVACGIFMVSWNARQFPGMSCFLFLGIAYLFVAGLDFLHTMAYTGMGVFPGYATDLPTQLWIVARYLESLSLLLAPLFVGRTVRVRLTVLGYAVVTFLLLGLIFFWGLFPVCFIEGVGLTPFKKVSEYVICGILITSIGLLIHQREGFDPRVLRLLIGSIIVTICSELAFTLYIHAYGLPNLIGHYLKIVSFYLIYKGVIEMGLVRPYSIMFRSLKQSEDALKDARDLLEQRVEERTAELAKTNEQLRREIRERREADNALRESDRQLRHLSRQLLEAHEKERKLVAHDLHDSIGGILAAINISLGRKLAQIGDAPAPPGISLEDIIKMVQNAMEETRRIQMNLRPASLDDLGILATINWFCREYQKTYPGVRIEQDIDIGEDEIPEHLKIAVFRITQEALSNVAKHSKAEAARVSLKQMSDKIELTITDNGHGFDLGRVARQDNLGKGLGLNSMRERTQLSGGAFCLESGRGEGTTIRCTWSLGDKGT